MKNAIIYVITFAIPCASICAITRVTMLCMFKYVFTANV